MNFVSVLPLTRFRVQKTFAPHGNVKRKTSSSPRSLLRSGPSGSRPYRSSRVHGSVVRVLVILDHPGKSLPLFLSGDLASL